MSGDEVNRDASGSDNDAKLSRQEAEDLAGVVTTLSGSKLALPPGLRAAAREASSPRLAFALREIASELEGGATLDDVMVRQSNRMPEHIRNLVVAAARSGKLAGVLADLIDFHRDLRVTWRSIRAALAYPLLVLMITAALLVVVQMFVATPFIEVFESMEVELPPATKSIKWWTTRGVYLAGWTLLAIAVIGVVLRLVAGGARWSRMVSTAPLFGSLFHLSAAAEFTHLLSILLKHDMPLPEALRLTASGMQNANLADASAQYAVGAASGASLSELLRRTQRAPASLTPLTARRPCRCPRHVQTADTTPRRAAKKRPPARAVPDDRRPAAGLRLQPRRPGVGLRQDANVGTWYREKNRER